MTPDHTFAICAYKENPFLEQTIESLEKQTIRSSIILSTSTPCEYIYDICERHNIPVVINETPNLAGDDWNNAYDKAQTKYVTLVHQDDIYEKNYLKSILEACSDDALLIYSDYYEIRGDERVDNNRLLKIKRVMNAPLRHKALNHSRFVKRRILSFGCPICCPAVTFNKEVAGKAIFDTSYINSSDYKTWVDLTDKPGRFVYVPEKLVGHRIYSESATSRNLEENIRKKEDDEILMSLWPRPIAKAINKIYSLSEKSNAPDKKADT